MHIYIYGCLIFLVVVAFVCWCLELREDMDEPRQFFTLSVSVHGRVSPTYRANFPNAHDTSGLDPFDKRSGYLDVFSSEFSLTRFT